MAEDDKELFESAMAEEASVADPVASEQPPQPEAQLRDENGRFAAKEQPEDVQADPEPGSEPEEDQKPQGIPSWRLKEEAEARRAAEERWQAAQRRIEELERQQAKPAEPEKATPEIWDDPRGFVRSELTPIQQQMQQQREQFSKMLAMQAHGQETVDAAYQAIEQAMRASPQAHIADYQAIMRSEHPYDALVQWHKRQETLRMVGTDPNAWLEAEMEKRLADPSYQAKVLEKIQGAAAANVNRSNPVTNLPPSLNRLPAGSNKAAENDASDAALFNFAMR